MQALVCLRDSVEVTDCLIESQIVLEAEESLTNLTESDKQHSFSASFHTNWGKNHSVSLTGETFLSTTLSFKSFTLEP
jgi:hypothetical protein